MRPSVRSSQPYALRSAAVLAGVAFALTACSGSSDSAPEAAGTLTVSPSAATSLSPSPDASTSGSAGTPTPVASGSSSRSSTVSPAPNPTPKPTGRLAPDGLPYVTIDRPEPGARVQVPVHISGTAVAFEAVLRYEILNSKGKLFTNGPAYADVGAPERGQWQIEIELPLGSYTVVAFIESPENGKRIAEDRVKFKAG